MFQHIMQYCQLMYGSEEMFAKKQGLIVQCCHLKDMQYYLREYRWQHPQCTNSFNIDSGIFCAIQQTETKKEVPVSSATEAC